MYKWSVITYVHLRRTFRFDPYKCIWPHKIHIRTATYHAMNEHVFYCVRINGRKLNNKKKKLTFITLNKLLFFFSFGSTPDIIKVTLKMFEGRYKPEKYNYTKKACECRTRIVSCEPYSLPYERTSLRFTRNDKWFSRNYSFSFLKISNKSYQFKF